MLKIKETINVLFNESKDELEENIKEAKQQIQELEKEISKNKIKLKHTKKDKKTPTLLYIIIGILGFLVILTNTQNVDRDYNPPYIPEPFTYTCPDNQKNPCTTCYVAASCVQFEDVNDTHTYVHFVVENRHNVDGDCKVKLIVQQNGNVLKDINYSIGTLHTDETKRYKFLESITQEESDFSITAYCDWN